MEDNLILLGGIPRSGTTLTCRILNQSKDILALVEPLNTTELLGINNAEDRALYISNYQKSIRSDVAAGRSIITRVPGGLGSNTFSEQTSTNGRSSNFVSKPISVTDRNLPKNFNLVLKHPNLFLAMASDLSSRFKLAAQIRNPVSVIASWSTLNHPLSRGHAPIAEELNKELKAVLSSIKEDISRQITLLDWYFSQIKKINSNSIVRYEDVIASKPQSLSCLGVHKLKVQLESKNKSSLYDSEIVLAIKEKLLSQPRHSCWDFYDRSEIEREFV